MGGIGLDELVGVDILHRARRRGRHPARAAAVVRKEEVRTRARVLCRRAWESGGGREFIRGGFGDGPSDDGSGRLGWASWVGCGLGLADGWWAQPVIHSFFFELQFPVFFVVPRKFYVL